MLLTRFQCLGRRQWGELCDGGQTIAVLAGSPFEGTLERSGRELAIEAVKLLPSATPTKIVCVGSNYRAHCLEMGRPIPDVPTLFLKPPSALVAHGEAIELPPDVGRVDFEGELAVVMGRRIRRANAQEAADAALGLTILNDVTARELQRKDVQFTRAKGFDTFCPVGPVVATGLRPDALQLTTRVNGTVVQSSPISDQIFGVWELVSFVSHVMTLEPGDVVSTGTPSGVGPLVAGDRVAVTVSGVGTLENPVVSS